MTRRSLLSRGAELGLGTLAGSSLMAATASAAGRAAGTRRGGVGGRRPVPLPTPEQVREQFSTMVEFGPRLTASAPHSNYIDWLEQEFLDAGLRMLPRDPYVTDRWLTQQVGLDILSGPAAGGVKIGAYYPRSQETPPAGVTGPLVYGGIAPVPSISFTDIADAGASLSAYPAQLQSWASGLPSLLGGGPSGSILLVDLPIPAAITAGVLMPDSTFRYWPGHTLADWMTSDYKRLWIEPGLSVPLAPFQALGALGVVFILDCSYEALKGGYLPFTHGFEPLPALYSCRRCTSTAIPERRCASRPPAGPARG